MFIRLPSGELLPPLLSGAQAARLLGTGRSATYEMLANGTFPSRTIPATAGGSRRVVTTDLLTVLGWPFTFVGSQGSENAMTESAVSA